MSPAHKDFVRDLVELLLKDSVERATPRAIIAQTLCELDAILGAAASTERSDAIEDMTIKDLIRQSIAKRVGTSVSTQLQEIEGNKP